MTIQLTLNKSLYGIEIDSSNHVPVAYSTNENKDSPKYGEQQRKELGYYSNLGNAAQRLIREEIANSEDKVSLNEFIKRYEQLTNELKQQFERLKL